MSTGVIVGIIVAVIVIGAVVLGVMAVSRRRRLQQRFGPEYDRVAGERDSRREAADTGSGSAAAADTSGQLGEPAPKEMAK